nr:MAG TPA: hypothetical protein [Bacteriophage sp.]
MNLRGFLILFGFHELDELSGVFRLYLCMNLVLSKNCIESTVFELVRRSLTGMVCTVVPLEVEVVNVIELLAGEYTFTSFRVSPAEPAVRFTITRDRFPVTQFCNRVRSRRLLSFCKVVNRKLFSFLDFRFDFCRSTCSYSKRVHHGVHHRLHHFLHHRVHHVLHHGIHHVFKVVVHIEPSFLSDKLNINFLFVPKDTYNRPHFELFIKYP